MTICFEACLAIGVLEVLIDMPLKDVTADNKSNPGILARIVAFCEQASKAGWISGSSVPGPGPNENLGTFGLLTMFGRDLRFVTFGSSQMDIASLFLLAGVYNLIGLGSRGSTQAFFRASDLFICSTLVCITRNILANQATQYGTARSR